MVMTKDVRTAIVVPVGPGAEAILDTLASVTHYCNEPHLVIVVDDCTGDGTYDRLLQEQRHHWRILRNPRPMGIDRLVHTLCMGFNHVLAETECDLVLRLDQDALLIKSGVISDAHAYVRANPAAGVFGVYSHDYNRPRSFESHKKQIASELSLPRRLSGLRPSWTELLHKAERRGYRRGDNVFGGAYFATRSCLTAMKQLGALDIPYSWHSRLQEDVYFSMAAVAAEFELGHFAAPDGPLCLEWRGLPYPAAELLQSPYKVVHSVDKGKNTDREANGGYTAREVFRFARQSCEARSLE